MNKLDLLFVYDPTKVKIKESCLANFWGMNLALKKTIHLTKNSYLNFINNGKRPTGTVFHECCHLQQQSRTGFIKFLFLYLLCLPFLYSPFRKKWELEAYKISLAYRFKQKGMISYSYRKYLANVLSSWRYGWMMSHKEAVTWINKTCKELYQLAEKKIYKENKTKSK